MAFFSRRPSSALTVENNTCKVRMVNNEVRALLNMSFSWDSFNLLYNLWQWTKIGYWKLQVWERVKFTDNTRKVGLLCSLVLCQKKTQIPFKILIHQYKAPSSILDIIREDEMKIWIFGWTYPTMRLNFEISVSIFVGYGILSLNAAMALTSF